MSRTVYHGCGKQYYHYWDCPKLNNYDGHANDYDEEYAETFWKLCSHCERVAEYDNPEGRNYYDSGVYEDAKGKARACIPYVVHREWLDVNLGDTLGVRPAKQPHAVVIGEEIEPELTELSVERHGCRFLRTVAKHMGLKSGDTIRWEKVGENVIARVI